MNKLRKNEIVHKDWRVKSEGLDMMTKYGEYQLRAASALSLEDLLTKLKRYYRTSEVILLLTGEHEWSVIVRGLTLRKAKVFRKFSAFELLEK